MKKQIALLILLAFFTRPLRAEEVAPQHPVPHVDVTGTAVVEVVPNLMIWNLQVRNTDAKVEDVAADHTKLVSAFLSFLKDTGVNPKSIQTSRMEFGENWESGANYPAGGRQRKGYYASTTVTFKLTDMNLYQKLWAGMAKQTGVTVEGTEWDYNNRITAQNEMRQKALLTAREKARSLANTVGSSIGEPLSIQDESGEDDVVSNRVRDNFAMNAGAVNEPGSSVAPGTISIRSTVRASFRLTAGAH